MVSAVSSHLQQLHHAAVACKWFTQLLQRTRVPWGTHSSLAVLLWFRLSVFWCLIQISSPSLMSALAPHLHTAGYWLHYLDMSCGTCTCKVGNSSCEWRSVDHWCGVLRMWPILTHPHRYICLYVFTMFACVISPRVYFEHKVRHQ